MPNTLRYPSNPDFTINNVNYNPCGNLRRPLPYAGGDGLPVELPFQSYAPYVVAKFVLATGKKNKDLDDIVPDGQTTLLVSTGSFIGTSKDKQAFIKSVTMGISQSYGATLEIIDTSGQDFTRFYNSVYESTCELQNVRNPDPKNRNKILKVGLLFGYVFTNDNKETAIYEQHFVKRATLPNKNLTRFIYFLVEKIEVTFDNNIWKYKIMLKAPDLAKSQRKVRKSRGTLTQRMPLLTALESMLDGECPPKPLIDNSNKVILARPPVVNNNNQNPIWASFKQLNAADEGLQGVYPGFNLPPLDAIQKNLNLFISDQEKGVYMAYPTGLEDDSLLLVEAESPECSAARENKARDGCGFGNFLGTYVVNGGDFSPVIAFNPKIEFVGVPNKVEGAANARNNSSRTVQLKSCGGINNNQQNENTPGLTAKSNEAATDNARTQLPPSRISQNIADSRSAALSAELRAKPMLGSISAELTIQGDPRFLWSLNIMGSFIRIIFINPFTVVQSDTFADGKINGTWLSSPAISDQISRAAYLVNGCDHEVSDGKWITKLKLIGVEDRTNRA